MLRPIRSGVAALALLALLVAQTALATGPGLAAGDPRSGPVCDASVQPVPGGGVALTDPAGGFLGSVTSDGTGFYSFAGVAPGDYRVQAAPVGVPVALQSPLVSHASDPVTVDLSIPSG